MEYPFLKCPKKTTDTREENSLVQISGNPPESGENVPQIIAQLIRQAVKVEEESMVLLNLLVEFIEQNPKITVKSDESSYPVNLNPKNRVYK